MTTTFPRIRLFDTIGDYVTPEADVPRPTRLRTEVKRRLREHRHHWKAVIGTATLFQCTSCLATATQFSVGETVEGFKGNRQEGR